MRDDGAVDFGAGGGVVEVDETFIGRDPAIPVRRGAHKHKVLALVDRERGKSFTMVVDNLKAKTLMPILRANIAKDATVYTDEAGQIAAWGASSPSMISSPTAPRNGCVGRSTRTPQRVGSASSSGA